MTEKTVIAQMATGVRNFDEILGGGWPMGSVTVIVGPPGSGKTVLSHQICFHNASQKLPVLYFNTLSEPPAKTLRYLGQFDYFEREKIDRTVWFVDLGSILRGHGLAKTQEAIMHHVKKIKPGIVVVDSFKAVDDLAKSAEEMRTFGYDIAVKLMAWEVTALLLGEYAPAEVATNPLFSIVDGLVTLSQRESSGEQQRVMQVVKMRGAKHSRHQHSFVITSNGIDIFLPQVTLRRKPQPAAARCKTGILRLDDLLGDGIPAGSSLLISGIAGTGKTVLLIEFIYRGALAGDKGIVFSFEETEERLRASARGLGWDLDREIERGMIEIVFIPQPNISVEEHLLMMKERIEALGARRVAVDSVSVFLHKIADACVVRERMFQLASIVHNARAVGFFATDIPCGFGQVSRFGVEETVADGVIMLTSEEIGLDRERYIEIYKLRNTAHLKGRHNLLIERGGLKIFPRYVIDAVGADSTPVQEAPLRLSSGTPGLDDLIDGGLLRRSVTLVSGSAGIGKSTLGAQFLLAGAKSSEKGILVTVEEEKTQILDSTDALGLPLREAIREGMIDIVYLSREHIRAAQFASILTAKVTETKARRLVLDSASQMVNRGDGNDEIRHVLYKLNVSFKALGVTSLFTLESKSLFSIESVTDRDFSHIADNIFMLRYSLVEGRITPTLTIVKTRGGKHERDTCLYEIGPGGLRLGPLLNRPAEDSKPESL